MSRRATLRRMNVAVRKPGMTRDQFLDWPGHQDGRYEFDGFQQSP